MPFTAYPVWSFPPNWGRGVLETLEFKTEVLISENGEEQRFSRRLTPRRYFEASFLVSNEDRQLFSNFLLRNQAREIVIPVWHDIDRLAEASASGTDTLVLDVKDREYVAGEYVFLRGRTASKWEVVEVEEVTATGLKLISTLEKSWPKGSRVYPAKRVIFEGSVATTKHTDRLSELSARFTIARPNKSVPAQYFLRKYLQIPVCEPEPDESTNLTEEYRRNMSVFDTGSSMPDRYDLHGRAQKSQAYRWTFRGRYRSAKMRELLYYLRGRTKGLWLPTFMDDFTPITQPVGQFDALVIRNIGYHSLGMLDAGYDRIRIKLSNGVIGYRQIIGTQALDEDSEGIIFDSPMYIPEDGTTIAQISYITLCRLDQDSIEINHTTDVDGVTTVGVIFLGPINASEVQDITSKPYTVINADGLQFSATLQTAGMIEQSNEWMSVALSVDGIDITTTYFPIERTAPEERIGVALSVDAIDLSTTYFPVEATAPGERIGVALSVEAIDLTTTYFPVNYNNWPAEGLIFGAATIVQASVT